MALGDNIRRLRVSLGKTQGDLSIESGVKLGQISKIERNQVDPKVSTIYKIMNALDCSADSIFMDHEKTGIKGVLKEAFESASKLPENDQISLITITDKFCIANGLNAMLNDHRMVVRLGGKKEAPSLLHRDEK